MSLEFAVHLAAALAPVVVVAPQAKQFEGKALDKPSAVAPMRQLEPQDLDGAWELSHIAEHDSTQRLSRAGDGL